MNYKNITHIVFGIGIMVCFAAFLFLAAYGETLIK